MRQTDVTNERNAKKMSSIAGELNDCANARYLDSPGTNKIGVALLFCLRTI